MTGGRPRREGHEHQAVHCERDVQKVVQEDAVIPEAAQQAADRRVLEDLEAARIQNGELRAEVRVGETYFCSQMPGTSPPSPSWLP